MMGDTRFPATILTGFADRGAGRSPTARHHHHVVDGVLSNLFSKAGYGRFIAAVHRFDSMERF